MDLLIVSPNEAVVELDLSDGSSAMTMLVYPKEIYNGVHCTGADVDGKVRTLSSVWK